ncbi:MAG: TonB-dependent receptor [Pseudomonadota bacterium]
MHIKLMMIIILITVFINYSSAQEVLALNEGNIEEVIVTGTKLDTDRQSLSTSVGYFDEERLAKDAIFNVEDIFDRTANAFTGTAQFGAYSIRGVNNNGIAGSINNSNALASIYINQTALGITSGDYIKPSLFDAQSVEILRGPQSSIQGPNSLIGAVLINYNKPEFDNRAGRARFEYGALETFRGGLVQNFVLAENVLATRLVVETRQSDGDVENLVTAQDDVQRTDETTLRLQFLWQPWANEDLSFNLSWLRNTSDSNAFGLAQPNEAEGIGLYDRQQPYNVPDEYPTDFDLVNLEADWQITDDWSFVSVTGYSRFDLFQGFDGDLTPFDFLGVEGFGEEDLFSQEFRFIFSSEQLDALIGLFWSDGEYRTGFQGSGIFPDGMGGIMPFNTSTDNLENIKQLALFGRAVWRLNEQLTLTAGLRFNREDRDSDNFADNNGFISELSAGEEFNQVIPSAAISWALSDTMSIGASYARGFQAGGIAFAVFLGQAAAYDEEFTDNYEIFLRHRSSDGRFTLNANAFIIDWTDQQVPFTLPGGFPGFDDHIANAGESSVRGFEVESEWFVTEQIGLFLSLGYTDTEFENFVLNGIDLSGQNFPQSPKWNVALGISYDSGTGWFANGTLSLVDEAYTEISAPDFTQTSKRSLLGGRVGYRAKQWSAYIWGTNLLDDDYELGVFDGRTFNLTTPYGRVSEPRVIGVGVELNW